MLRTKLFKAFAALVLIFGVLSAFLGIKLISKRIVDEAQTRVRLNLSSAWAIHNAKLREIEVILKLAASKDAVVTMCEEKSWTNAEVSARLEKVRASFGFDFLDVVAPNGQVMVRTTEPHQTGDYKSADPAVSKALKGVDVVGLAVLSESEMKKECDGLADRAFIQLEETPRTRLTQRTFEDRGMVMVGAVPVRQGSQVIGVIYAGVLMNKNCELVDRICEVVFKIKGEHLDGAPVGTATLFLNDCRIATTVRKANGNRAIGTRASKEVADQVLDNGRAWEAEAFVVNEGYLTAYEPIRDVSDQVIGMLYVGILKRPFDEIAHGIVKSYVYIFMIVLVVALIFAYIMANTIARPIHKLVEAANSMRHGNRVEAVQEDNTCHETTLLVRAFNQMASTLAEREENLKALNRSYMETLGFVSHELKSPIATIMNYVYLIREKKLGPLTEKQEKAALAIDRAGNRVVEMVRHYLNLSRIESGDLKPVFSKVSVVSEVLKPIIDSNEADFEAKKLKVVNDVGADVMLNADMNMVREVFENLVSNAIKYSREEAEIRISCSTGGQFVEFAVRNQGPGIPADRIGTLFQKFSRISGQDGVSKQKGTGLGLFITKTIVETHGGKIGVTSQPGEWAEFTFTLPVWRESSGGPR